MVDFPTIQFLVISDLYERYTVVMNAATRNTSVYCEECGVWVERYEGDQLSRHTQNELLEKIVADHEKQIMGEEVSFEDSGELL